MTFDIAVWEIGRYISVTASRLSDTCRTSSTTPTMRNQEVESKPAVVRMRRSIGLVLGQKRRAIVRLTSTTGSARASSVARKPRPSTIGMFMVCR